MRNRKINKINSGLFAAKCVVIFTAVKAPNASPLTCSPFLPILPLFDDRLAQTMSAGVPACSSLTCNRQWERGRTWRFAACWTPNRLTWRSKRPKRPTRLFPCTASGQYPNLFYCLPTYPLSISWTAGSKWKRQVWQTDSAACFFSAFGILEMCIVSVTYLKMLAHVKTIFRKQVFILISKNPDSQLQLSR